MPLPPSLPLSLSLSHTHTHTHIEWNLHDSGAAPSIALAPCRRLLCGAVDCTRAAVSCVVWSIAIAPPSFALAHRLLHSRAVYFTLAPPFIALSRRRQSHSRRRQRRLRHTYFLVSVRCFSEEKVRSAVSVGNSVVSVIVLAPLSIKLTPPAIALVPRRRQSYSRRTADNCTPAAPLSIVLAPRRRQSHSRRAAINCTQKQRQFAK